MIHYVHELLIIKLQVGNSIGIHLDNSYLGYITYIDQKTQSWDSGSADLGSKEDSRTTHQQKLRMTRWVNL